MSKVVIDLEDFARYLSDNLEWQGVTLEESMKYWREIAKSAVIYFEYEMEKQCSTGSISVQERTETE